MANSPTAKQLGEWIAQWESGPAREKHLFGFLEPDATADLAEYLSEHINKSSADCQLVECEGCGELAEDLWTIDETKPNDFFGKLLLPLRVCNDCIDNAIEAGDLPEDFR
jgi:hypothetical protein